jgi:hypothetical protein
VEWGKDSALALRLGRVALSWSGGRTRRSRYWRCGLEQRIEPQALITTVTAAYGRVNMHGVRRELVRVLACALRSRLVEVAMPASCPDDVYEARTAQAR